MILWNKLPSQVLNCPPLEVTKPKLGALDKTQIWFQPNMSYWTHTWVSL